MSIISLGTLKAWAATNLDTSKDDVLTRCISAATLWLQRRTGRVFEQAAYTRYFDGEGAGGKGIDTIFLDPGHRPVMYDPTGTPAIALTVTEDGTELDEAIGYNTTADVIIVGANLDEPCRLIRNSGTWAPGKQNIEVEYTAGWLAANVPAEIGEVICEVAWLFFQSPSWLGKGAIGKAGSSVSIEKELPAWSKEIIEGLRVY